MASYLKESGHVVSMWQLPASLPQDTTSCNKWPPTWRNLATWSACDSFRLESPRTPPAARSLLVPAWGNIIHYFIYILQVHHRLKVSKYLATMEGKRYTCLDLSAGAAGWSTPTPAGQQAAPPDNIINLNHVQNSTRIALLLPHREGGVKGTVQHA